MAGRFLNEPQTCWLRSILGWPYVSLGQIMLPSRLSPKYIFSLVHKVQNAQSRSYPKFQIILWQNDIAPKVFCLVQAGLKWAFWCYGISSQKKQNNTTNQCRTHFLTSDEMPSKKYIFLDLVYCPVCICRWQQRSRFGAKNFPRIWGAKLRRNIWHFSIGE